MACIITYKNNKYSQQEFEKYFKNNFNEFVNEFLTQDIEGFKEFVNRSVTTEISFDKELHNKIEEILRKLYPEINLTISKLPKFEGDTENIIGQANIKAFTVLIDAINQKQDTLPHEYAHHYIAWFRNTPLVQEAIKKWGSEESLVQAIGEQVVKQKGEAWNWWKEFSEWVKNIFNKLSGKSKEELRDILASAFLQRIDVRTGRTLDIDSIKALVSPEIWNQTNTSKVDNSGSKKKLSNLKDAFETILDKLERRRKILENLGKEKQTKIYNTIIAKLETQYKAEKYLEGINLFLIEGHNMFDSIQKDLKKFYDGKYNANVIRRMGSFASSFKVMLEETSRGLYEERKNATGDRLAKIKELQVRVAELQDIVKNVKEDWLELSRRVTSEFLYAFDQYRTKEELYNILSKPVKDISTPNTWFNSILESNDEMSRLIGKAVSDTRELARLEVLRTQQDFVDLKKELEKGGIKDTSWMYSTYNGNKTEEFVSERDWAYYNNLKSELYKEANKIFEDLDIGYYEYLDMSKGDKAKFINSLSPSKKSQFNIFKTKEKKFYAENTLSEVEVLRLKDEMINKLSKEDYEIWLKLNVEVRNGKEIVPSKKSVQYIEIQSNPLKKKFYDKVMKHKVELTDSFPDKFKEYRLAPQIRKDSIERLKGKDFSGLMADAKESYKIFEDEEKRGSNLRLIDEEGNLVNFIPIYFSNKIKDINNLTDDVASSMIAFVNMGINRRALTGILDSLELSREVIKARGILRVDSLGRPIKGKKKFAGKEEIEEQINIEKGAGRVYEMLNQFLLDTVYGQKDVPLGEVMGVDVARLIDTLSMHTALVQLGVNIYAGIANVNVAKAMIRIEAASGQFFSFRDVLYADQIYAKELPKTLGDIGQRKFNSKVTLWLEKHDTLENYNEEIAGLDLERKTMFSRLFNKSALFFLSRSGEHYIHGRGSIALSNQFRFDKSTNRFVHKSKFYSELRDLEFKKKEEINNLGDKLKQLKKEGKLKDTIKSINDKFSPIIESKKKELDAEWDKMTNYWDAHEVVNNRLVLKDEFKGSNWQQDHLDYTNMQHAINQELHGNYGPYGAALQRYAWGRAIMMFHKWLKPYWDRRYKRLRYDHRKQSDVEGYYTTVFNFAMQLAKDMRDGQYSLLKNWSALTTQEKANFNRAFTEVAYVLALAVLSAAIMSIREGGDDDSWAINMTAYQLNRLITEVGVMTPSPLMFSESLRLIQSPAASVHMVDDLFKVFDVTSWFKEIERGRYKDMYGIQKNIIKVTPILKQAFDYSYPEEKLVFYNSSK